LGGTSGIKTLPDAWGDIEYLTASYSFLFTTNDGRFATTPTADQAIPSGVSHFIIYPSGIDYYSVFALMHSYPGERATNIDPSGVYLDANGLPTLRLCFNKPVDVATLNGTSDFCFGRGVTIMRRNVLGDPFVPEVDLSASGTWDALLWQATFTFNSNQVFQPNEEIEVTIPSNIYATDGTSLGTGSSFYFTTRFDPLYAGASHVRAFLGQWTGDVPDDTINRLIHSNSILAVWYSVGRPAAMQPFRTLRYYIYPLLAYRPAFNVDPITGPPEFVKRFVLYKTCLDIMRAKYLGIMDGIFLGGGPGAAKTLADLHVVEGGGSIYASTIGPIIEWLDGIPGKQEGEVKYWLGWITGTNKWKPPVGFAWGINDPRTPHRRSSFIDDKAGYPGFSGQKDPYTNRFGNIWPNTPWRQRSSHDD
jgi:hypothetical protein